MRPHAYREYGRTKVFRNWTIVAKEGKCVVTPLPVLLANALMGLLVSDDLSCPLAIQTYPDKTGSAHKLLAQRVL